MVGGVNILVILVCLETCSVSVANLPLVITTWEFTNATDKAWAILNSGGSALDAVEYGATVCEMEQCDGTVGFGGSPDERGETTLDALIMDGDTMKVGAVGGLRQVKRAMAVARLVLEHTRHSLLVGDAATHFAEQLGFTREPLATNHSKLIWKSWKQNNCQPNFWMNVIPDPQSSCGPYKLSKKLHEKNVLRERHIDRYNHDTIGLVVVERGGRVAAGTSTNGASHKIPGRVGDSPIPGSGAYADSAVGGAAATGDGDVMLRFLPSFLAVEEMRRGASPSAAARTAVSRVATHHPEFSGAVVAATMHGVYGAACHGMKQFPYSVHDPSTRITRVIHVDCI